MDQNEIDIASRTDGVLKAALDLFVQANKGPVRGMRAFQIDKKERVEFAVQIKKLVDDLGPRFEAVYPQTAKAMDEALVSLSR